MSPVETNLLSELKDTFGHDGFLPGQQLAVESVLNGEDTLLVLPTGGGKSLCYQLPSKILDGQTLVISPLISLMQDQLESLREHGIKAEALNSSVSSAKQKEILQQLKENAFDLVYMAPERLRDRELRSELDEVSVSLFAIDEAHCISEWGHDFRPDYLRLPDIVDMLGNPTVLASTATATPKVRDDIRERLHLTEQMNEIVTGFNRSNLSFIVQECAGTYEKKRDVDGWLNKAEVGEKGSGIVYVSTRQRAEDIADYINENTNFEALHYHAGMNKSVRRSHQSRFANDDVDVVVATNAFGMGIDKPDVRLVLHWNMPGNVESYYQEAGRAGRDGDPAFCVLYYDSEDVGLQEKFIEWDTPEREGLEDLYTLLRERSQKVTGQSSVDQDVFWHENYSLLDGENHFDMEISVGKKLLEEAEMIDDLGYRGRRQFVRFLSDDTGNLDVVMDRVLEHRRHRENQLNAIIEYSEMDQCRRQFILNYFGDDADPVSEVCCDVCNPDEFITVEATTESFSPATRRNLSDTYLETYHYVKDGLNAAEIEQKRAIKKQTIQNHFVKLLEEELIDETDIRSEITEDQLEQLRDTIVEVGSVQRQKPLKERLPENFSYGMIRIGMHVLKQRESLPDSVYSSDNSNLSRPEYGERELDHLIKFFLDAVDGVDETASITKHTQVFEGTPVKKLEKYGLYQCPYRGILPDWYKKSIKAFIHSMIEVDLLDGERGAKDLTVSQRGWEVLQGQLSLEKINLSPDDIPDETIPKPIVEGDWEELKNESESSSEKTLSSNPFADDVAEMDKQEYEWTMDEIVEMGETGNPEYVPDLIEALRSEEYNLKRCAASALGKIADPRAVEPLLAILEDENPQVRQYAVKALGKIGDEQAIAKLGKLLNHDPKEYVRNGCREAIQKILGG